MKIHVRTNTKVVIAGIRAEQEQISKAQVQALNRTVEQVRTAAAREIRVTYNVKAKVLKELGVIRRAGKNQKYPEATVTFTGRGMPLIEFDPKEKIVQSAKGKRRGVTVRVLMRGGRKLVTGGFAAIVKGKPGIFRRAGKNRFPIKYQTSISIPMVVRQKAIEKALIRVANTRYEINFEAALRNQVRRG